MNRVEVADSAHVTPGGTFAAGAVRGTTHRKDSFAAGVASERSPRRPDERGRAAAPLFYPGASLRSRTGARLRLAIDWRSRATAAAIGWWAPRLRCAAGELLKASGGFADLLIEPSVGTNGN